MRINCNAKINLGLFVTAKREDGFHEIESLFLPIPWYDVLEIKESEKTTFASSGLEISGDSSSNLCLKAYHLLAQHFLLPPVSIHLEKNIPIGAGLGGGSSDAAFMLKGLNEMFRLNLSIEKLKNFAAELGSDCPFFIENKVAYVSGRGENLDTSVSLQLDCYCLVVHPNVHISTKQAYQAIKPKASSFDLRTTDVLEKSKWQELITNDFEEALLPQYPLLQELKDKLEKLNPFYVAMSGSGSTYFALFKEKPNSFNYNGYSSLIAKLKVNQ